MTEVERPPTEKGGRVLRPECVPKVGQSVKKKRKGLPSSLSRG